MTLATENHPVIRTDLGGDSNPPSRPLGIYPSTDFSQSVRNRSPSKPAGRPFLLANEWAWNRLPSSITTTRPIRLYGAFLHSLVQQRLGRMQYHGTFFLRNRPELELIRRLANQKDKGSELKITVLGCSNGAEVYSILWTIRSARPDLKVIVNDA